MTAPSAPNEVLLRVLVLALHQLRDLSVCVHPKPTDVVIFHRLCLERLRTLCDALGLSLDVDPSLAGTSHLPVVPPERNDTQRLHLRRLCTDYVRMLSKRRDLRGAAHIRIYAQLISMLLKMSENIPRGVVKEHP